MLPFQHYWAFIDESGNENLDTTKECVSGTFIITLA